METILYPTNPEIINGSIILVEGLFDMLNLWDKGLRNVVFTSGTSFGAVKKRRKQANNIEKLLQYKYQGVNTIYIMYDGDTPGRDAAENLKNYIGDKFVTQIVDLPDDIDPGKLSDLEVEHIKQVIYI